MTLSRAAAGESTIGGRVIRRNPRVLARELGGEAVLLDLDRGTYFGLNEVGSRTWALLGDHSRLAEVAELLLVEYEVSADRLWPELEALVVDLARHGLVDVEPELGPK